MGWLSISKIIFSVLSFSKLLFSVVVFFFTFTFAVSHPNTTKHYQIKYLQVPDTRKHPAATFARQKDVTQTSLSFLLQNCQLAGERNTISNIPV